jgi:hypothetical protein
LLEWLAFERLEPFETERADQRQSLHTFWMRQTWIEDHKGRPADYCLDFEGEKEKTEADILMDEVKDLFNLR